MVRTSSLRKKILKGRGVELAKHTRKPVTYDELPSRFRKSRLMQYIELKHNDKLENLIFKGTIYEAAEKLGIDASTVSKWRKLLSETKEEEFWEQFPEVKEETNSVGQEGMDTEQGRGNS